MLKLTPADLWKLEDYARERPTFRQRVLAHKAARSVTLGTNISLLFEDRVTVQYQVQEMLRIERIYEATGIADELTAYNPLIPDGSNFKATMLIEFPDELQRRRELQRLRDIENCIFMRVGDHAVIRAIADEDLDRSNEEKTSAVHFLRFECDAAGVAALHAGTPLQFRVEHPHYQAVSTLPESTRLSLIADLD